MQDLSKNGLLSLCLTMLKGTPPPLRKDNPTTHPKPLVLSDDKPPTQIQSYFDYISPTTNEELPRRRGRPQKKRLLSSVDTQKWLSPNSASQYVYPYQGIARDFAAIIASNFCRRDKRVISGSLQKLCEIGASYRYISLTCPCGAHHFVSRALVGGVPLFFFCTFCRMSFCTGCQSIFASDSTCEAHILCIKPSLHFPALQSFSDFDESHLPKKKRSPSVYPEELALFHQHLQLLIWLAIHQFCPLCATPLQKDFTQNNMIQCLACQFYWCYCCQKLLIADPSLYHKMCSIAPLLVAEKANPADVSHPELKDVLDLRPGSCLDHRCHFLNWSGNYRLSRFGRNVRCPYRLGFLDGKTEIEPDSEEKWTRKFHQRKFLALLDRYVESGSNIPTKALTHEFAESVFLANEGRLGGSLKVVFKNAEKLENILLKISPQK